MLVTSRQLSLSSPFTTERGGVLRRPVVAYEEYGDPEAPAVLVTHGGTSSHHAAGRYTEADPLPGFWDGLIGPGRALDTRRLRVICANALAGTYGTTSPMSTNPDTQARYGPLFPDITFVDVARFMKQFLDELGVRRLELVIGPSMGGLLTLQLAALYPDMVRAAVAVAAAGRLPPPAMAFNQFIEAMIRMDPDFEDGWYAPGHSLRSLKHTWQVSRILYTHELGLKELAWDPIPEGPAAQEQRYRTIGAFIRGVPDLDMKDKDANCLLALLSCLKSYSLGAGAESYEDGVGRIRCPLLLLNVDTDLIFQPTWAEEVARLVNARHPGDARAAVLRSRWGHMGCVREVAQLDEHVRGLIETHHIQKPSSSSW